MGRSSVLLVDDDAEIGEILVQALRDAGYRVRAVQNGAQALAALEESRPSVMLVDLMMPVMGGWQFLDLVRSRKDLQELPVIIITASTAPPPGRHRVIKKPFDLQVLLDAVSEHCGHSPAGSSPSSA